jgi:hypothetical protein
MYGKNPEWADHLRTFGEEGTFKIKTDTTQKLHDRGVQCMFIGYGENHNGDIYIMWNPKRRKVHIICDVIFLKLMLFQTLVDEVAVVPIVTKDITDAGESDNWTQPTETGSEMSGGDGSDDHSDSNPDSESEDEDGELPGGTTGEWHMTRSGRTSHMPSRYHTKSGAA